MSTNGNHPQEPNIIITGGHANVDKLTPLTKAWESISRDPISSLLFLLYSLISVATFRHSMIGFASLEEGNMFWGAVAALAIDAGLMLSATGLRSKRHPISMAALVFGLIASVLASAYSQLLFSVMHAQAISPAPGAAWLGDTAIWLIQKRVVIMSALLPLLLVAYSFAAHSKHEEPESKPKTKRTRAKSKPKTKTAANRCKDLWLEHGFDKTAQEIADLAGCHVTTANRVRLALQKEKEHA